MNLKNKIYTFSMREQDSPFSQTIQATSNWEGLSTGQLLNLFRLFLVQIGFSENYVKKIQDIDEVEPDAELYLSVWE